MKFTNFIFNLGLRLLGIFLGISLLIWLAIEDITETIAIVFAIFINAWLVIKIFIRINNPNRLSLRNIVLAGFLAGLTVTPLALSLLVIKTGMHAHTVPDYSYQDIISVIRRTPIWLIGGIFISMGLGIWIKSHKIEPESEYATER